MTELVRALRPVKRRIRMGRLVRGGAFGFAAGAAAALILMAVSVFLPVENRWIPAAALIAGGALLGAAGNALRRVPDAEAARAADACGLQERTVTALETADRQEESGRTAAMLQALQEDACAHLRTLDPKRIRFRAPWKGLIAGAAALLLCAAVSLIPGEGVRMAAARSELKEKTARMAAEIDEAEAAEEEGKTEEEKAELRKLTEDLKRELADSRDAVDALVAVDRAEQRLEQMRQKTAGDALQELADALRQAGMNAAADAMESGDGQSLAGALAETDADSLRQAAEGLSGEAKEAAEQLAQAMENGESAEAQARQISGVMQGAGGTPQQASPLQQTLSGMTAALGDGGQQDGSGAGSSAAGSGGQGQQAGGGAGSGTTNEEQQGGGNNGNQAGKGSRPPEFRETEYETIYDPEKAEAAVRDVTTEQNKLGNDSVQIEAGPGKGTLEGNVPWREVVGEYAQSEAQAAESAHLTREQKQWVDEYFRKLTDSD